MTTQQPKSDPKSVLEWVEERPEVTEEAWLYRSDAVAKEHQTLRTAVNIAERLKVDKKGAELKAANRKLGAARKKLETFEAESVEKGQATKFVFTGIGAQAVDELEWAHPPTAEQIQRFADYYQKRGEPVQDPGVDLDAHSVALIHASMVEPEMSLADVDALWKSRRIQAKERAGLLRAARAAQGAADEMAQLVDLVAALGQSS